MKLEISTPILILLALLLGWRLTPEAQRTKIVNIPRDYFTPKVAREGA